MSGIDFQDLNEEIVTGKFVGVALALPVFLDALLAVTRRCDVYAGGIFLCFSSYATPDGQAAASRRLSGFKQC